MTIVVYLKNYRTHLIFRWNKFEGQIGSLQTTAYS